MKQRGAHFVVQCGLYNEWNEAVIPMRQTNISLEEWQYFRIKELAEREGKSISQIIREMIDLTFPTFHSSFQRNF